MRWLRGFIFGVMMTVGVHILILGWDEWFETIESAWNDLFVFVADMGETIGQEGMAFVEWGTLQSEPHETLEENSNHDESLHEGTLHHDTDERENEDTLYIGMSKEEVLEEYGDPSRKDPSAYGYEWWVYHEDVHSFMKIGMRDREVVTFYSNAPEWQYDDFYIGMPKEEWADQQQPQKRTSFRHEYGYYTFILEEEDMEERPLWIDDDRATQLYLDVHEGQEVAGMRVMDIETLLLHRPYTMQYIGLPPEVPELSDEQQQKVAEAYERQILDILNVSRDQFDLPPLEWHEGASDVARGHSEDMLANDFFDHISPSQGDLGDRLNRGDVYYKRAGENIAWNYIDAADVHHGWLNSPGHRKNLTAPDFTHLGIGVVDRYYTQNFISK